MDTLKSVSPLNAQVILKNLGLYLSQSSNARYVYLTDAILLLWNDLGDEFIKERCKERDIDFIKLQLKLKRIRKLMERCQEYYNALEDKVFRKKDLDKEIRKYYFQTGSKIALLLPDLFKIYHFLSSNSTICRMQVKSEDLKLLEHQGMRKMQIGSTRSVNPPDSQQNINITRE
jgi:hypothetical protein